jgi:hypothetical protein
MHERPITAVLHLVHDGALRRPHTLRRRIEDDAAHALFIDTREMRGGIDWRPL